MSAILNARRLSAFRALWRAVRRGRQPGAPGLGQRVTALPRMLGDAFTGRYPLGMGRLGLFLLGVAYLISPVDLVPEVALALFGIGDDALVAMWLAGAFLAETDRYLAWERELPQIVDGEVV